MPKEMQSEIYLPDILLQLFHLDRPKGLTISACRDLPLAEANLVFRRMPSAFLCLAFLVGQTDISTDLKLSNHRTFFFPVGAMVDNPIG